MKRVHGFTLLEMAIVLIIISFVVGAIFTAQTLLRSSQLHLVLSEYDTYVKAISEFQDKFLALPGDMKGQANYTPEDMWGSDPCGCPCATATSTKIRETCNGDGSGTIGSSDANANGSNMREWFRAWQQLADAGFISGTYTGTMGTTGNPSEAKIGVNVPASALSGAGWTLLYYLFPNNGSANNGAVWRDDYGHILTFGGFMTNAPTSGAIIKPEDAYAIDAKIDDGMPGTGKVRASRTSVLPNCTVNDTSQTNQSYNTNNNINFACSLYFLLGL